MEKTWLTIFIIWCFAGIKFNDSLQETIVSIQQVFEEGKPFLQLLQMENCEKTVKKNFNEIPI